MKKLDKLKFVGSVFMNGAKVQLKQPWVFGAAASIGLSQGLKYNGSIKRGVKGGAATLGVFMGVNGVYSIICNWDKIKEVLREE